MLAASISFFAMMAIVPFCLFLFAIFGYVLGENREFFQFFSSKLVSFFPKTTSQVTAELEKLITYKGLGKFSLALYGFLSYQLFSALESALHVIFKVNVRRSFVVSFIFSIIVVTLIIAFLFISFSATSVISMPRAVSEFFPKLEISKIEGFVIRFIIPFLLVFSVASTLYVFLPGRMVRFSHALSGALFTAVFLETAKHLFTLYVANVFTLGTVYGPLSAFVIFLLWVFYSACIFLIGAEVTHGLGTAKDER